MTIFLVFWGCYFGATILTSAAALFAFARRLHRIALNAALAAMLSAIFVLVFLGALPIEEGVRLQRVLAVAIMAFSCLLPASQALQLGLTTCELAGLVALVFSVCSALRGDRQVWVLLSGVVCMLLALGGLGWIALDRAQVPWFVHVFSALAATAYVALIAVVLWMRYYYPIELQEVMAHGPSHDPVTRMRTHQATASMVGEAFKNYLNDAVPLGMIVVSIGNLPVLQNL